MLYSGLARQIAQHVDLPGELQAQVVMSAVEGFEDLLGGADRVLECGGVGGTGVLLEPRLPACRPVPVVSLERRQLRVARDRPRSEFVCFDEERANATAEGSVAPLGEQLWQRQRHD